MSLPNRRVLEKQYEADRRLFEVVLQEIGRRFHPWFEELGIHPSIKVRVKSFKSFFEKYLKKLRGGHNPEGIRITDVLGLRVVCPFLEEIPKIESLVWSKFTILEQEKKGSVHSFKEFGYESTHFLVSIPQDLVESLAISNPPPVEIQVRTILQDAWAEVEHELIYKAKFFPFDQPLKRKLAALNANLTLSDIIFQEIREYQRQLHEELNKRKRAFSERLGFSGAPGSGAVSPETGNGDTSTGPEDPQTPSDNLDQLLLDALQAHNQKQTKKAINYYSQILKMSPTPFVQSLVLVHRGMAYFVEELFENALDDFSEAVEKDGANTKALYYLGVVLDTLGRREEAHQTFDQALAQAPFHFDSLMGRARVRLHQGHLDGALEDCDQALALHPEDLGALALHQEIRQGQLRGRQE